MNFSELVLPEWEEFVVGQRAEECASGRLFLAVKAGNDDAFKAVLAEPDVDAYQLLGSAVLYGHLPIIRKLVEAGLDVNRRVNGCSMVIEAMRGGHVRTALYLAALSNLADAEILLQALRNGYALIAMLAVEDGADPNAFDHNNDRSALEYAASKGYLDCVYRLLEKGADVAKYGPAALDAAKADGRKRVIARLQKELVKASVKA